MLAKWYKYEIAIATGKQAFIVYISNYQQKKMET